MTDANILPRKTTTEKMLTMTFSSDQIHMSSLFEDQPAKRFQLLPSLAPLPCRSVGRVADTSKDPLADSQDTSQWNY